MPADGADRAPLRLGAPFEHVDVQAFASEVEALHGELKASLGAADYRHLLKMVWWTRLCTLLGYSVAWIMPNPISALLIGLGNMGRWANITHPVMHRGMDKVPGVPARYTSKKYAKGWRRYLDWLDWLHPDAWALEHNGLHHYHTSQVEDPDIVERNAWFIRSEKMPRLLKWMFGIALTMTWKWTYYAPNTFFALKQHHKQREHARGESDGAPVPSMGTVERWIIPGEKLWFPTNRWALEYYARCVLPYGLFRFGLVPALFLPLGTSAWLAVLINSLLAEIVANIVTFVTIAPNHTGDDLYRFDTPCRSRAEFYLQQCASSVNYPGGQDWKDFLQGHLNYQIEHHLWPDLPLLKYQQAAPRLKEICRRHGVPYIEESVFKRFGKTWSILLGDSTMLRVPASEPVAPA
jgi:fatty acid desaturase